MATSLTGCSILCSRFQQNATLLRAVRRRRRQASSDRSKTPLLDVGLDEDEASLAKVDMNNRGTVGADSREEVLCLESMDDLIKFLAVASEEDGSGSWTVTNTNDIACNVLRAIVHAAEGLVVATVAVGLISYGVLVKA